MQGAAMGVSRALRITLTTVSLAIPVAAVAEPALGPSVYGGLSFHHTEPSGNRSGDSYGSTGLSFGLDYQIPQSAVFSIVPFTALSLENSDNAASSRASVNNGVAALEGRVWYRSFFMGLHGGYYVQEVSYSDATRKGGGFGWGLSLGTKPSASLGAGLAEGTYVMVQIDHGKNLDVGPQPDADRDIKAFRLFMGYRFP
ncbi:hypothetical protein [Thiohalorhabdus methylotrophus]|uniref:Outer membrane protein beta-barrel domain-containing protein n=1 Tax=Thiohalorhabdus methylotrophus TaxID=3242694 RepID=A0ABV4TVR3_9GAMM